VTIKQAPLLAKLRKDPQALRQLLDFVRRPFAEGTSQNQITVANQTYTLRRLPTATKEIGY
jgi:hypothetical protein